MSFIASKISKDGKTVGFIYATDEGSTLCLVPRSLYTKDVIEELTSDTSGYSYRDYDPMHIETPEGTKLSELPDTDYNDLSKEETYQLAASEKDAVSDKVLTDVEASRYYKLSTASTVNFKEESEYSITTREDFIKYIKGVEEVIDKCGYVEDNRPINSFVSPDARFTITEINSDNECLHYFTVLQKRHVFRNYKSYMALIKFLVTKGVLKDESPTYFEFLKAYYSWGVDGINDTCISQKFIPEIDGNIDYDDALYSQKSSTDENYTQSLEWRTLDNRSDVPVIIDSYGNIRYNKTTLTLDNRISVAEFDRSELAPKDNTIIDECRESNFYGYKYKVISPSVRSMSFAKSKVYPRVILVFMAENGYEYKFETSGVTSILKRNFGSNIYRGSDFSVTILSTSVKLPITEFDSEDDYKLRCISFILASVITFNNETKTRYNTTMEMLKSEGISTIAATRYVANTIINDPSGKEAYSDLMRFIPQIVSYAASDIPEDVLKAFMLDTEDDWDIYKFLQYADIDDLRDRRSKMMNGQLESGMLGYDPTFHPDVRDSDHMDAVQYYMLLDLADKCLTGSESFGKFREGKLKDAKQSIVDLMNVISSVAYAENMNNATDNYDNFMRSILDPDQNYFDISDAMLPRNNASIGLAYDQSKLRECLVTAKTYINYVTAVYREISNAPANEQLPYMIEMVQLDPDTELDCRVLNALNDIVVKSIESDTSVSRDTILNHIGISNESEYTMLMRSSRYIAARLFFACASRSSIEGFKLNIPYGNKKFTVDIDANVVSAVKHMNLASHVRYMTLYDYCNLEYNPGNNRFQMFCVNARIEPWSVTPRTKLGIISRPFVPNYYSADALNKSVGDPTFYQRGIDNKAIRGVALKEVLPSLYVSVPTMQDNTLYNTRASYADAYTSLSDFEDLFDPINPYDISSIYGTELPAEYVQRFTIARHSCENANQIIKRVPLRQDVLYKNIVHYFGVTGNSDILPEVVDTNEVLNVSRKDFMTQLTVKTIVKEDNISALSSTINIHRITPKDLYNSSEEFINSFITGVYRQNINVIVGTNSIHIYSNGERIKAFVPNDFTDKSVVVSLVNSGAAYKIANNMYYIPAANGDFILEVTS